ncbi:MAG: META domain-containing protein [Sphingomonadales bacterium]|nr:META domain-containing protein [Sphingomonadales bacterium]
MFKYIAVAALPLLAACTSMAPKPDSTPLVLSAPSGWTFVKIDGKAPKSAKNRLLIEADRISATVGCNNMGGSAKIEADRLVTGPLMSTKMFCEGLMEQEQAVGTLLGASPSYVRTNDRLVLKAGTHSAELKLLP